mmetsp:Transcript_57015/g.124723  ORF Transcript_57015/g.124723 Transcript_57015/m.124723 type:complete len:616 (+) Transcript_57015:75-1922(+)
MATSAAAAYQGEQDVAATSNQQQQQQQAAVDGNQAVQEALKAMKEGIEALTAADGPYPLAPEDIEHFGTVQKYLCFQDGPNSIVYHTLRDLYSDSFARNYDKTCVVYEAERLTYGQVWEKAAALARVLAEDYGMERGSCIAIGGRNTPQWLISFLAVTGFLSCTALAVNAWWVGEELQYGLEDSGAKLLIAEQFLLDRSPFLADMKIPCILMRGDSTAKCPPGTRTYEEILTTGLARPAMKMRPVHKDDSAMLMYTSGTTNKPKGVVMTHRSVMTSMNGYRVLTHGVVRETTRQPALLIGSPLFHATATHAGVFAAFCQGAKLCFMYKWNPTKALQMVQDEKVEGVVGVPTMTYDLANHEDLAKYDTSSLLAVGGGGAQFAAPMIKRVNDKLPSAKAGTGYGLTETNALSCLMPGPLFPFRPTSCGIPLFHLKVCILDENNKKMAPGGTGEICFHGAVTLKEYWNKPEKTAEVFHIDEEGALWFRSGDLGMLDEEGFLYILDRAKDLIIRGGENISCSEVETAVFEHPSIVEVAAIGLPHEHLGEVVAVAVVTKPGVAPPSVEEIKKVASQKLAGFKVPTEIYFWPDALPRGATGKIQKRDIRDALKEKRSTSKL